MSLDGLWTTPETSSTLSVIHFPSRRNSRSDDLALVFRVFCLTTLKDHLKAATVCGSSARNWRKSLKVPRNYFTLLRRASKGVSFDHSRNEQCNRPDPHSQLYSWLWHYYPDIQ
jgi:hypothetical protein